MKSLDRVVEELEKKHAKDQETIADNLVLALYPLWKLMDFNALDSSTALWVATVLPRVRTAYLQSQHVAAAFAANVRFASLPTAEPLPIVVPPVEVPDGVPLARFELPDFGPPTGSESVFLDDFPAEDVATSLVVEANSNVKGQMPGPEDKLMAAALVNSTGAAVRQALKGARNVTHNVIKADRRILGYARFTDGNPCHFCALLASRGAVYTKSSFVEVDKTFDKPTDLPKVPDDYLRVAKVHNNCRCTLRPVYTKSQEFDAEAKFYRKQWNDVWEPNKHLPAEEIVKIWRENYKVFPRKDSGVKKLNQQLADRESALLAEGFSEDSPQVRWARRTQGLLAS